MSGQRGRNRAAPAEIVEIHSFTIYHSPNAYLGMRMAERVLAGLPVKIVRQPIFIPRERGLKVADLVGSHESQARGLYHREDCARWATRYGIPLRFTEPGVFQERARRWSESRLEREELPARAYYAAQGSGRESDLDRALFEAAWVDLLDVNEPDVVARAATAAGLDSDALLHAAESSQTREQLDRALQHFERAACPGVPTWILGTERFWGKDRVEFLAFTVRERLGKGRPAPGSTGAAPNPDEARGGKGVWRN